MGDDDKGRDGGTRKTRLPSVDEPDGPATSSTKTIVTQVSAPLKRQDTREACLVIMYGDDLGRRVPLGDATITMGRSSQADVHLDQESVSRNHCKLWKDGHRYFIEDLQSTNGTYVNDELVSGPTDLRDGDQLKVGRTILKFIIGGNIEAQYHEEIYRLMTVDGLTQVYNKRYFDEMLEREVSAPSATARSSRSPSSTSTTSSASTTPMDTWRGTPSCDSWAT
jgi:two-component system, cell cycle response regulator